MNRLIAISIILGVACISAADPPAIKPKVPVQPPVAALAFSLDNRLLAAAVHKHVFLIDPANGNELARREDEVHALEHGRRRGVRERHVPELDR